MTVLAQVFPGSHHEALARADALDAGTAPGDGPHVDLGVAPEDLDELGQIAARTVRFGSGDTEPVEVDLDHDRLFELPAFWVDVLAELAVAEDPEAVDDVAAAWADTEGMADAGDLTALVRELTGLATQARTAGRNLYLWVADS